MFIDLAPEEIALRDRLRAYLDEMMTPALEEELEHTEGGGPLYHQALRKMGADGWLGIGWPRAFGGQERPAIEQFLFFDEVQRAGFPIPFLTLNTVGPAVMAFGSEAQKAEILPKILAGELHFAIGYTEPEAGTDLASLKTTAVRDGEFYVVNGQKVFTSLVHYADYVWLAARTDPAAPKHKGISILMVDVNLEGFSMSPTETLGDNAVCTTYYEDVRVPASCLVGAENAGWKLITTQLNHERIALSAVGPLRRLWEEVCDYARETGLVAKPWVQQILARVDARTEILKLMNWRQATSIAKGALHPAEASAVKVYGSELYVEAYRLLLEVLGPAGSLKRGSPGAILQGRLERYYRATLVLTFGGGTNEVQREIIATTGLRMPRSR